MKLKHGKPSLLRIVGLDAWAGGAILLLIILWATLIFTIATADSLSAPYLVKFTFYVALAATAVAGIILIWRIRFYQKIFSTAVKVRGVISANLDFEQQAGSYSIRRIQVEYIYEYQGQLYRRRADIFKMWIKALQPGREVEVIVDPNRPKRAFIKQLYM